MKKITDTVLDRSIDLALVAKPPANAPFAGGFDWVRPVYYETNNSSEIFVRMPHGQYALRVMSKHPVDLLFHVEGVLRNRCTVPAGVNYVECDGDGKALFFLPEGEKPKHTPTSDAEAEALLSAAAEVDIELDGDAGHDADIPSGHAAIVCEAVDEPSVNAPLTVPTGHGVVFVVARFSPDLGPGLKPPAQEYEAHFVMNAPADHAELLASKNLLTMTPPEPLVNADDEVSFEPPQKHRPSFVCTCTGCRTGGSHRNY